MDHEHFSALNVPPGNFSKSLNYTLDLATLSYPFISSDNKNTYVAFAPDTSAQEFSRRLKTLTATLSAVGISSDSMEIIPDTSFINIAKSEIRYGTPPETEKLTKYLNKILQKSIRDTPSEHIAAALIRKLSGHLQSLDMKPAEVLPSPKTLSSLDRVAFLDFYNGLMNQIQEHNPPKRKTDTIESLLDDYFKSCYPPRGRTF